ncbi:hypothetical protein BJ546DRAFT_119648 [Cryomyces antarcticus]
MPATLSALQYSSTSRPRACATEDWSSSSSLSRASSSCAAYAFAASCSASSASLCSSSSSRSSPPSSTTSNVNPAGKDTDLSQPPVHRRHAKPTTATPAPESSPKSLASIHWLRSLSPGSKAADREVRVAARESKGKPTLGSLALALALLMLGTEIFTPRAR